MKGKAISSFAYLTFSKLEKKEDFKTDVSLQDLIKFVL